MAYTTWLTWSLVSPALFSWMASMSWDLVILC
jgi:hypothetical protein